MPSDAKGQEHKMEDLATTLPSCEGEGSEHGRVAKKSCMEKVKAHITKFLALFFLLILALVVAALHQQMMLRSDWEAANNETKEDLQDLFDFDETESSSLKDIIDEFVTKTSIFVKYKKWLTALNRTYIIQRKWDRTETGLYYHKFSTDVTYNQAQKGCSKWTGRLAAAILNDSEAIRSVSTTPAWIGYDSIKGTWDWVDGDETNHTVISQYIGDGFETQDANSQCGYIQSTSDGRPEVSADVCNAKKSYLCEVELNYVY